MIPFLWILFLTNITLLDRLVLSAPSSSSNRNSRKVSPDPDPQLERFFDQIGSLPNLPDWVNLPPHAINSHSSTINTNITQGDHHRDRSRSPPRGSVRGVGVTTTATSNRDVRGERMLNEAASRSGKANVEESNDGSSSEDTPRKIQSRIPGQGREGANDYWTKLSQTRKDTISKILSKFSVWGSKYHMVRTYASRVLNQDLEARLKSDDDNIVIEAIRTIVQDTACAGPPSIYASKEGAIVRIRP